MILKGSKMEFLATHFNDGLSLSVPSETAQKSCTCSSNLVMVAYV